MPAGRSDTSGFPGSERFRVLRRLGEGGTGLVFEAEDVERGARVALKTLRTPGAEAALRLKHEFRALQDLEHPNLVALDELLESGGRWFFTMELVAGEPFLDWVRPGDGARRLARTIGSSSLPETSEVTRPLAPAAERLPAASGGALDERRLRAALAQLAAGLCALHRAAKVHRDVKPSNVLVTAEGRVVILDFGLVLDAAAAPEERDERPDHVAGTAGYMAPERWTGQEVGPAADWYSVGVMLYQALTGRHPYQGAPALADGARPAPPPPSELARDVPADLEALALDLLRAAPGERPADAEVLRRLGLAEEAAAPAAPRFVGRAAELVALAAAAARCRQGSAVTLLVTGESGVGKSALVRRFAEQFAGERGVVLAGRCYERESLPFKAVDRVVEALARALRRDGRIDPSDDLPLLAEVFPALRRVEGVAALAAPAVADPQERRTRLFAALRGLLGGLARRAPLLVTIDDLQWADADSLALLADVLRPPAAPILLVATLRAGAAVPALPGEVRQLALGGLPEPDARALAAQLIGGESGGRCAAIAAEAGGHPLFIEALAAARGGGGESLDDAIWARVTGLDVRARELCELAAVAGHPLAQRDAAAVIGADLGELAGAVAALRAAHLIRTGGPRPSDAIEPYHDRVREAVGARLDEAAVRAWHRRLAHVLEAAAAAAGGAADRGAQETLALHWREAGEAASAARYAAAAAEQAAASLAFDRAARLYQQALALATAAGGDGGGEAARALGVALGEALANAGRGGEAAAALQAAAEGAPAAAALDLRRRAAEQLLRSGRIDDGLEALGAVLGEVGIRLPGSGRRAVPRLLARRAALRLRGLRFTERAAAQVPAGVLARVDVCWSAAIGLAMVDVARGAYFQTRMLSFALRAGEPYRIALALALEAASSSASGPGAAARTAELLAASRALADRLDDPHALGMAIGTAGIAAYLEGRFGEGLRLSAEAETIYRTRCGGATWECMTALVFRLWSLTYLGRLPELAELLPGAIVEAERRGDRYTATLLRTGTLNVSWLAADDVAGAGTAADAAMEHWSRSGFLHQHWDDLLARGQIDLYVGDAEAALQKVEQRWRNLERGLVLYVRVSRDEALDLRARAALATLAGTRPGRARTGERIRQVLRDANSLERGGMPWGGPLARRLHAAATAIAGDAERAAALLEEAAVGFSAADMPVHAAACRFQRGRLLGGSAGAVAAGDARAALASAGCAAPERMAALLVPGF